MQIFKALEAPFRLGLESLNESLPDIRCEVIISRKSGALVTVPPFEELRAQYYRALKRFVVLPSELAPLHGASSDMFARMASLNNASLVQVYRKAEFLFARLARRLDALRGEWEQYAIFFAQPSAAPAVRDLLGLRNAQDETNSDKRGSEQGAAIPIQRWSQALSHVKQLKRDATSVPDLERVHCVRMSLGPLRNDLEDAITLFAE